jgi:hypothetical protein
MKEVIKVALGYGEPKIARAEVKDGYFELDLLLVGLEDGKTEIVIDDESLSIEVPVGGLYTKAFKLILSAGIADWREAEFDKMDGVLYVKVPVLTEEDLNIAPEKFTL